MSIRSTFDGEKTTQEESFMTRKKKVIEYIRNNDYISTEEVRNTYSWGVWSKENIDRMMKDPDVICEIERKRIGIAVRLRKSLDAASKKGNVNATKMLYALVGSEEELARLNGGGLKLSDVKALGVKDRQPIVIKNLFAGGKQTFETKPSNGKRGRPPKKKLNLGEAPKPDNIETVEYEEVEENEDKE